MNRIDEFADKFQGWLAEWAEKRQAAQNSCFHLEGESCSEPLPEPTPPAGIYQGNSEPSADDGADWEIL